MSILLTKYQAPKGFLRKKKIASKLKQGFLEVPFIHKMAIALKEANETDYWIELLCQSKTIEKSGYDSIKPEIVELLKLLVSIVKTSKRNLVDSGKLIMDKAGKKI